MRDRAYIIFMSLLAGTLTIGCGEGPAATPTPLPSPLTPSTIYMEAGRPYGPTPLQVTGGVAPYVYEIVSGQAPTTDFVSRDGVVEGLPAVPGTYTMTLVITDGAGVALTHELVAEVAAPAELVLSEGEVVTAGEYWVGDLVLADGQAVSTAGDVILNVTGRLSIPASASLTSQDCGTLVLNLLDADETTEVHGILDNRCDDPTAQGGDLILRTRGSIFLGSDDEGAQRGRVASSGMLFVGDPDYRPRDEAEVLEVAAGTAFDAVSPVCAVRLTAWPTDLTGVTLDTIAADPDGGEVTLVSVDWGDGAEPEPGITEHDYAIGGTYEVTATFVDDEGAECVAALTVDLPAPPDDDQPAAVDAFPLPSVWAVVEPFEAASLIRPMGTDLALSAAVLDAAAARWEFDDRAQVCDLDSPQACALTRSFDTSGRREVVFTADNEAGERSFARLAVYAPLVGGLTQRRDPAAPGQPFPALPQRFGETRRSVTAKLALSGSCPDCGLCGDPRATDKKFAVLGSTEMTSWWQGGGLIIGFNTATVVIQPTFVYLAFPGRDGEAPGESGKVARGFGAATYSGKIVVCGGTFRGAKGGDGAPNAGPLCHDTVRGGRGAGVTQKGGER